MRKYDFWKALTQGLIKNNFTEEFKMPKKQKKIVLLEKEELAHFLKLAYTGGLKWITLSYVTFL
ncbi:hypothetical protein C6372_17155 [Bacillus halotolerans]|nr:hypothetical protein C6372_17155 [Bacillus halotolerans]